MSTENHFTENKCDICGFTTDNNEDVICFGDWMKRLGITVHYFCLLLSTNLAQNGGDNSGILGFLKRDIRLEIRDAKLRKCSYCDGMKASIACYKCKKYFHLVCGHRYNCLFQFSGDFRSYCDQCVPLDECQIRKKQNPPVDERCYICAEEMGRYVPTTWIYGRCCGNGYVHRMCMRKYALAAGYYLICIWCRSKDFRDDIRLRGIYVPDRDAKWELERNAYAELHRRYKRCNMEVCNCPEGRNFERRNWTIIVCTLCGSFGAHYPGCISSPGRKKMRSESFKCNICLSAVEYASYSITNHHESETRQQRNETIVEQTEAVKEDHLQRNKSQAEFLKIFDLDTREPNTNSIEITSESSADAQNIFIITDFPEFDDELNVLSTYKVRINLNSPRFQGKTIDDILEEKGLITDTDKFEKTNGPGVFKKVEDMIAELKTKIKYEEFIKSFQALEISCIDNKSETLQQKNEAFMEQIINSTDDAQTEAVTEDQLERNKFQAGAQETSDLGIQDSNTNSEVNTLELCPGAQNIFIVTDYPEFDDELNVLSTCKVRINLNSPRFQGKTIDDILEEKGLITDTDKFQKINGPGVFQKVQDMIAKFKKKIRNYRTSNSMKKRLKNLTL